MRLTSRVLGAVLVPLWLGGCSVAQMDPEVEDTGDLDTGAPEDTGAPQDSSDTMIPDECPAPTGSGTVHTGDITADETWAAADGPHEVPAAFSVLGATLTIEPCTVVRVAEGVTITIGANAGDAASLVALGEDSEPITFESATDDAYWGSLSIYATGSADLSAVTLRRGSDVATAQNFGGALRIFGDDNGEVPTRTVRARGLSIEDAEGLGINIQSTGGFTDDSEDLVVTGSGTQPVRVAAPSVQTIPPGEYTGNTVDAILVEADSFSGDETFHARGVPYRIDTSYAQLPSLTAAEGGLDTLTIDPGVTITMLDGFAFNLGAGSDENAPDNAWPVQLIAAGTEAEPIVFTSAATDPAPGDWSGIEWSGAPSLGNVMTHVTVEYAGSDSSTLHYGCGPDVNDALLIIKNWEPAEAFIEDCTFRGSAAGGIVSGWQGAMVDLHAGNTFEDIANECAVSLPVPEEGGCPGAGETPDCY